MKLAIIGDPVSQSRSPQLHEAFLRDAGLQGTYSAVRVGLGEVADCMRRMRVEGYTGINVTTPLKEEAFEACDEIDDEARLAHAVNTIFFGKTIAGTNTDGIGARSALETLLGQPVALERIGILGTGPTARAIFAQLRETDAYTFVWGRDSRKVAGIQKRFEAAVWPQSVPEIVISTLPPNVDLPHPLIEQLRGADIIMDANYGERSTLERVVRREVVKGDLMLEAQARASFDFWLARAREELDAFTERS